MARIVCCLFIYNVRNRRNVIIGLCFFFLSLLYKRLYNISIGVLLICGNDREVHMRDIVKGIYVIGISILLAGCSSSSKLSLLQDEVNLEYGETLPDLKEYVDVAKLESKDELKEISIEADSGSQELSVGEHEYHISYGRQKKTITVVVKDTTPPKGSASEISLFENETADLKSAVTVVELSDYTIQIDDSAVNYNKAGAYEAKAKITDASNNQNEVIIPVIVKEVKLELSRSSATLEEKGNFQLTANTNLEKEVEFSSSNPSVATVDQKGNITAVSPGRASVTAKINGKTSSCDITVESKPVLADTPPAQQIAPETTPSDDIAYTVYITKTGEKYHRDGCRYLKKSKIAIDKSSAINQGYTPCSVCHP